KSRVTDRFPQRVPRFSLSDSRGGRHRCAQALIPGVGKKTADRICLELHDKLVLPEGERAAAATPSRLSVADDVHSALVNLGYRPRDADVAIEAARKQIGTDAEFSAMLKAALRQLTKS